MAATTKSSSDPPGDLASATRDAPEVLSARGLVSGYGTVPVVHDLDISVRRGEVVMILGANGAGKTTTLLTLAGILRHSAGELEIAGKPESRSVDRRIRDGLAFVPEERSITAELSCRDNLRLGRGSVQDALSLVPELEPLLRRRAGLLSGGEQQMLTMARALASKPALLMADELSLGLAPKIVDRLLKMVAEAARSGVGVLLVEQHARKALRYCDRAYVLKRGRIVLHGTADEMLARLPEIESSYLSSAGAAAAS